MKSAAFANFALTYLPVLGLAIFLIIFIGVCVWVCRAGSNNFYEELSQIPFEKDKS